MVCPFEEHGRATGPGPSKETLPASRAMDALDRDPHRLPRRITICLGYPGDVGGIIETFQSVNDSQGGRKVT
jgi:hypothetical protein